MEPADSESVEGHESETSPASQGEAPRASSHGMGIVSRWASARRAKVVAQDQNETDVGRESESPKARPRLASQRVTKPTPAKKEVEEGEEEIPSPAPPEANGEKAEENQISQALEGVEAGREPEEKVEEKTDESSRESPPEALEDEKTAEATESFTEESLPPLEPEGENASAKDAKTGDSKGEETKAEEADETKAEETKAEEADETKVEDSSEESREASEDSSEEGSEKESMESPAKEDQDESSSEEPSAETDTQEEPSKTEPPSKEKEEEDADEAKGGLGKSPEEGKGGASKDSDDADVDSLIKELDKDEEKPEPPKKEDDKKKPDEKKSSTGKALKEETGDATPLAPVERIGLAKVEKDQAQAPAGKGMLSRESASLEPPAPKTVRARALENQAERILRELRIESQKSQSEANFLLDSARQDLAKGDLDGALSGAEHAEGLDPALKEEVAKLKDEIAARRR